MIEAAKARLLVLAGAAGDLMFPGVPTLREQVFDLMAKPWCGLFAPAGTPGPWSTAWRRPPPRP